MQRKLLALIQIRFWMKIFQRLIIGSTIYYLFYALAIFYFRQRKQNSLPTRVISDFID